VKHASDDRRDLAIVAGVILALTLPFLGKPVHVDDVYFIEVAQNILRNPLRPFAGAVGLEDIDYRVFAASGRCPSTFPSMSHPPLVPYVIALAAALARGFSEPWLHLAFVPFAVMAGLAMCSLARRFTHDPLAATLLLVSSPVFIMSSHSLMTDMPAFALALGGLALFVRGIDEDDRGRVLAGGLLTGLAVTARYSAVLMVAVLLGYAATQGKLRKGLPALAGAALAPAAWSIQNLVANGELHLLASTRHYRLFYAGQAFDGWGLVKKMLGDLSDLGGTAFAAASLLALTAARRRLVVFALAAISAAAVFALHPRAIERLPDYSAWQAASVAGCFGLGVLLLAEAVWTRTASGDEAFLVGWLLLALAGAIVLLPFGSARYLLPALAPLWLLLARRMETGLDASRRRRAVALVAAQGVALAVLLALADSDQAARYRSLARSVRASYPDRKVWFVGEWGFRYYMGQVGAQYLSSVDDRPQTGDIIVRPYEAGMHEMSEGVRARSVAVQEIPLLGRWPVRLMSFEARAGYYSHHWGYLPWALSRAPLERVEIFEVRAPAPRAKAETCASS
jgi:hypothetical protein